MGGILKKIKIKYESANTRHHQSNYNKQILSHPNLWKKRTKMQSDFHSCFPTWRDTTWQKVRKSCDKHTLLACTVDSYVQSQAKPSLQPRTRTCQPPHRQCRRPHLSLNPRHNNIKNNLRFCHLLPTETTKRPCYNWFRLRVYYGTKVCALNHESIRNA